MNLEKPKYGYSSESIEDLLVQGDSSDLSKAVREVKSSQNLLGFIGGPPCPDFSIGGKNKGHAGENGRLSKTYAELIKRYKPDFFLFENVKGLWRTRKHREFYDKLKHMLDESGYLMTDRLSNCIEFGVAQDRDRILLFGVNKSSSKIVKSKRLSFSNFNWEKAIIYPEREAFSYAWPDTSPFRPHSKRAIPKNIPVELTVQHWFDRNKVERHTNSKDHFKPKAGLAKFKIIEEGDDSKKSFKRLHRWRYSPTAAYGNNEVHLHPYKERRISAAEALAIQSLPIEFELPAEMSLTNMFKTIGNGVPFLMSKGIAISIRDFLEDTST